MKAKKNEKSVRCEGVKRRRKLLARLILENTFSAQNGIELEIFLFELEMRSRQKRSQAPPRHTDFDLLFGKEVCLLEIVAELFGADTFCATIFYSLNSRLFARRITISRKNPLRNLKKNYRAFYTYFPSRKCAELWCTAF